MIQTTHVGSLPRGPELAPLLLARDHGEAYDAAEFDRVVQAAVDEAVGAGRRPASASSATASSARSAIRPTSSSGSKASAAIARASPRSISPPCPSWRRSSPHHGRAGIHPRRVHRARSSWSTSSRCTTTSAASARRSTGTATASRAFMNAASPGPDHRLPAQPVLSEPRGLSGRSRRRRCGPNTRRSSRPASSSSSTAPTSRCPATPATRT